MKSYQQTALIVEYSKQWPHFLITVHYPHWYSFTVHLIPAEKNELSSRCYAMLPMTSETSSYSHTRTSSKRF